MWYNVYKGMLYNMPRQVYSPSQAKRYWKSNNSGWKSGTGSRLQLQHSTDRHHCVSTEWRQCLFAQDPIHKGFFFFCLVLEAWGWDEACGWGWPLSVDIYLTSSSYSSVTQVCRTLSQPGWHSHRRQLKSVLHTGRGRQQKAFHVAFSQREQNRSTLRLEDTDVIL